MGYWRKNYKDGSSLLGIDEDPDISWSRTKLENMVGVVLVIENYECTMCIEGEGDYWQSDTYECQVGSNKAKLIKRRIEMKEKEGGKSFSGYYNNHKEGMVLCVINPLEKEQGFWNILEYDLRTKTCRFYSSKEKI